MQWIQEVNPSELGVIHLRSGKRGIVPNNLVQLDKETPLRLAENNRGKIQQYLMHYNVQGAYLIRYSTSEPKGFVLSILQPNKDYNTLHWHCVIHIKPSDNRFYFSKEKSLEELDFSSFHELIANETVRSVIPLTGILPLPIDFEQEIGKRRFNELEIGEEIGNGKFEAINYVHRDLACRNILLDPHENIVKIADLGLSTMIPSTSPDQHQAAANNIYLLLDVWSFGILLIEIWLKDGEPYENKHQEWIKSAVRDGCAHERPSTCPVDFYDDVIRRCLTFHANDRPTFKFLNQRLSLKNIRLLEIDKSN
ncbi:unnamed protein product [Rotaria socialis]